MVKNRRDAKDSRHLWALSESVNGFSFSRGSSQIFKPSSCCRHVQAPLVIFWERASPADSTVGASLSQHSLTWGLICVFLLLNVVVQSVVQAYLDYRQPNSHSINVFVERLVHRWGRVLHGSPMKMLVFFSNMSCPPPPLPAAPLWSYAQTRFTAHLLAFTFSPTPVALGRRLGPASLPWSSFSTAMIFASLFGQNAWDSVLYCAISCQSRVKMSPCLSKTVFCRSCVARHIFSATTDPSLTHLQICAQMVNVH